jgi:riboflavin biosynthesis pyrimidine reductase
VLVGINTIVRDDPLMMSEGTQKQAQPVVLDCELSFPLTAKALHHPKGVWIFAREGLESDPKKQVRKGWAWHQLLMH